MRSDADIFVIRHRSESRLSVKPLVKPLVAVLPPRATVFPTP